MRGCFISSRDSLPNPFPYLEQVAYQFSTGTLVKREERAQLSQQSMLEMHPVPNSSAFYVQ